ncbi:ATP-binding protein [Dactylosporangium salmoneum]
MTPQRHQVVRWRPPHGEDAAVAADARAWARRALPGLLAEPARTNLEDDVELLVSELAANAVLHAGGLGHVELHCTGSELRIVVHDEAQALPVPSPSVAPDIDHGRGMLLVELLATRWGVRPHPGRGKDVWLDLPL